MEDTVATAGGLMGGFGVLRLLGGMRLTQVQPECPVPQQTIRVGPGPTGSKAPRLPFP